MNIHQAWKKVKLTLLAIWTTTFIAAFFMSTDLVGPAAIVFMAWIIAASLPSGRIRGEGEAICSVAVSVIVLTLYTAAFIEPVCHMYMDGNIESPIILYLILAVLYTIFVQLTKRLAPRAFFIVRWVDAFLKGLERNGSLNDKGNGQASTQDERQGKADDSTVEMDTGRPKDMSHAGGPDSSSPCTGSDENQRDDKSAGQDRLGTVSDHDDEI